MARVTDAMLESIVKNEGYINGMTEVSPMGVLRLALDLQEARSSRKEMLDSLTETATANMDIIHTSLRALGYWATKENPRPKDPDGRSIEELITHELQVRDDTVKSLQFNLDRRGKEIDRLRALLNRPEVAEALVRSLAQEVRADVEKAYLASTPVPPAPEKRAKKGQEEGE